MVFNETLEVGFCDNNKSIFHREAVRAVVLKDKKLLMIHTNRGDYKFPGGGIEEDESHEEALIRELMEETGYCTSIVKERIGLVVERRPDKVDNDMIFEMASNYYMCEVSADRVGQKLNDYEAELDFQPIWISIEDAISRNQGLLDYPKEKVNAWVGRELYVLRTLKDYFK